MTLNHPYFQLTHAQIVISSHRLLPLDDNKSAQIVNKLDAN